MHLILILMLTSARPMLGADPPPAGVWKIESAVVAPWWKEKTPPDASIPKPYLGKTVAFAQKQIDAPALLRCSAPHYEWKLYPPDMLFQGMFGEMASRDQKVGPAKIAASLGFRGTAWRMLETGCHAIDFHFLDGRTTSFALDNYIFFLKKQ